MKDTIILFIILEFLSYLWRIHGALNIEITGNGTYGSYNNNVNRLFLANGNLTIGCRLSGGTPLISPDEPTLDIWNSSWHKGFLFTQTQTLYEWEFELRRDLLDTGHPVQHLIPKEQWKVRVEAVVDGVTISTTASILDQAAEPFLFWTIGTELSSAPSLSDDITRIRNGPCVPDVAWFAYKTQASNGFYFVRSYASFEPDSVQWFQITASSICGAGCAGTVQLLDIALTNHRFVVLTTAGVHISNDIRVYDTSVSNTMTFETVFDTATHVANPVSALISYSGLCAWRQYELISSVADVITIIITDNTGATRAWYSRDPFSSWHEATSRQSSVKILDGIYNMHMKTMTFLVKRTTDDVHLAEVTRMNDDMSLATMNLVRPYPFPSTSVLTNLFYLPLSSLIFATGEEVWMSEDGGNTFSLIHALTNGGNVTALLSDTLEKTTIMETSIGFILYGKSGVHRMAELSSTFTPTGASLQVDALGNLFNVSVESGNASPITQQIYPAEEIKTLNGAFARPLAVVFLSSKHGLLFEHKGITTPGTTSLFSDRNVGQEIKATHGGSGLIEEVTSGNYVTDFLSVVKFKITSTWSRDTTTTDLQKHNLGVTFLNQTLGTAELYLDGYLSGQTGWSTTDVSKTVVIPGATSFLITNRLSDSRVEATAVTATSTSIAVRPARTWYLIDLGVFSGVASWSLEEGGCRHLLVHSGLTTWPSQLEMDLRDTLHTVVRIFNADSTVQEKPPMVLVTMSNPWLLKADFTFDYNYSLSYHQIDVSLTNYVFRRGITSLRYQVPQSSLQCEESSHSVVIYSGCPCLKRMIFIYPYNITDHQYLTSMPLDNSSSPILKAFPVNYRPPSQLGVGVPTSVHIYNADPGHPRPHNTFRASKSSGELKICRDAANKEACGCTDFMRLSSHPNHTDCKEKVFRLLHPGVLRTHFVMEQYGRADMRLADNFLVTLTEINDRAPKISSPKSTSYNNPPLYEKMVNNPLFPAWSKYFVPNDLQVVMNGSGLYHFKAEMIEGVSFCDLQVYFQLYVDQAPIAYPLQYILNFGTALIFGGVFFGLYLWYYFHHHTHRVRRVGSQCLAPDMID